MKITFIVLLAVCSFLYLFNLGGRDFWAPDEGDFAQIVTEMGDNPVVPHLNGIPYGEKPPLFYFITYLSQKVFYFFKDETSMRLATALLSIAGVLVIFLTIKALLDIKMAVFSSSILFTTPLYYWQARFLQTDMAFSTFIVGCLSSFLYFYRTEKKVFYYLSAFLLGLAFLTKGPLSLLLVAPILVIFLGMERRSAGITAKDLCMGGIIFLLVVLPWYLAVYIAEGPSFLYENIIRQNITRFFDAWSHRRPFYYYATTLPLDFFPWSLFLPLGIYLAIVEWWRKDSANRFFLLWFAWMFFFLSLSSGKISKYMLPLLPSAAFLSALALSRLDKTYNKVVFVFLSAVFFVLSIILFFYRTDLYGEFFSERIFLGILMLVLTSFVIFSMIKARYSTAFFAIVTFMALSYATANIWIYSKWNIYKSPKPLCEKIKKQVGTDSQWVYYGSIRGVYIYYTGKFAVHVDEHRTEELLKLKDRMDDFYILSRKRDLEEIRESLKDISIVFEDKIGGTAMVFVQYKKAL